MNVFLRNVNSEECFKSIYYRLFPTFIEVNHGSNAYAWFSLDVIAALLVEQRVLLVCFLLYFM